MNIVGCIIFVVNGYMGSLLIFWRAWLFRRLSRLVACSVPKPSVSFYFNRYLVTADWWMVLLTFTSAMTCDIERMMWCTEMTYSAGNCGSYTGFSAHFPLPSTADEWIINRILIPVRTYFEGFIVTCGQQTFKVWKRWLTFRRVSALVVNGITEQSPFLSLFLVCEVRRSSVRSYPMYSRTFYTQSSSSAWTGAPRRLF